MSIILAKICKFLTNPKYRTLLWVLATSPQPLKTYEIKNKMGNKYDKYVYIMIDELHPPDYIETFLFNWDDVPTNDAANKKLINNLKDVFSLSWLNSTNYAEGSSYRENLEGPIKSDDVILIKYGSNHSIRIEHEPNRSEAALLTIDKKSTYPLIIKKKNKKLLAYLKQPFSKSASYLKYSKSDHPISSDERSKHGDSVKLGKSTLMSDRNNWKYSLNIRGLILYILGEIQEEDKKKGNQEKKGKTHNSRIDNALSNLSKYYTDEFPFLLYYNEFREVYKKLAGAGKLEHLFNVKLIKKIAEELRDQLSNTDTESLRYWVARRYSNEIINYFDLSESILFAYQYTRISRNQVKDFKIKAYSLLMKYLQSEYRLMKKGYHYCLAN